MHKVLLQFGHASRSEGVALNFQQVFTEITEDGSVRHPVFQGLRVDKEATDVVVEKGNHAASKKARN